VNERQLLSDLLLLLRRNGFRYYLETHVESMRPFRGVHLDRSIDLQCDIFAWRSS